MEALFEGLGVTVIGMGVVFLVLFLLTMILKLFEVFLYRGQKRGQPAILPKSGSKDISQGDEDLNELVVAVSAVMAEIIDKNECLINIRQLN